MKTIIHSDRARTIVYNANDMRSLKIAYRGKSTATVRRTSRRRWFDNSEYRLAVDVETRVHDRAIVVTYDALAGAMSLANINRDRELHDDDVSAFVRDAQTVAFDAYARTKMLR